MTQELERFKQDKELATAKVGQMEAIKKMMESQLKAAEDELKLHQKKAEELELKQEKEQQTFNEQVKKALGGYETNKM